MEQINQLPENDLLQAHFSILVAFTAIERDLLIKQNSNNPSIKKRLKKIDFMLDEYAIKILERGSPYEC